MIKNTECYKVLPGNQKAFVQIFDNNGPNRSGDVVDSCSESSMTGHR